MAVKNNIMNLPTYRESILIFLLITITAFWLLEIYKNKKLK